ncbi:PPR repeat protein [Mucor ambiguus]|uniref:PPR repeat protein n=1 Tax=Mucor ambiguus TaxID=91626 RepID=A0A0C9MY41_9FUNG|nr:PPR repeat protein [Mucor ambiguus]
MYGVKGTSTILNSVARQGVLTKQLVAPKSTAFLANLPTRQVSAGKLSYTTRSQTQFNQKQDVDASNNSRDSAATLAHLNKPNWTTVKHHGKKLSAYDTAAAATASEPAHFDIRILQAAKQKNSRAVVDAFVQGRSAAGESAPPLSTQTYEAVIQAYGKLRKINQPLTPMMNAYHDMISTGVRPSSQTYALLIRSLCNRDSEVQKTVSMLKRQIARTGNTVHNLGDLENEKNMEKALALFNKAVTEKSTQDFDTELYNTLLRGLSYKGNTQDGLYIYEHLESAHNANPNGMTFATLMSMFGTAGDLVAVRECFNEYKTLKKHLPSHDATYVYNAFVYAHVNAGDIPGALDIIENVMVQDRVKITILPFNKIVRRACFDGNMDTVDSVLAKLEADSKLPNPDASTYGMILSAYSHLKDFDKATKVYHNLLNHDISKQYGHLADYAFACTNNHMPDQALDVVKAMTSRGLELDSNLCKGVVLSFVNNGRMDDAVTTLKSLIGLYTKKNFLDANSPVSDLALDLTLKCKDLGNALSILQVINNYSIRPTPAVCEAVVNMYQEAKSNPDVWQRVSKDMNERSFFILYDIAFRKENTPEGFCKFAFELLKDMHALNVSPSASLYVRVLTRMKKYEATEYEARWKEEFAPYMSAIEDQIKDTKVAAPKAEDVVASGTGAKISESVIKPAANITVESDLLSAAALDAALGGKFDEAIDVLNNKIIKQGKVPTPEAVRDMIQLSTKLGRLDAAEDIYKTVIDSVRLLEGTRKQRGYHAIYNSMLVAHARHGDLASAKIFYDKLREHDLYPDGDAYGSLLACNANSTTDESTDALAIYEESRKHNVRPTVYLYNVILSKLAKCRKIEPVLRLFNEMKQLGVTPNSITYASVISACIRCSSESRAAQYFQEMISSPKYQPRIGAYNSMIQFYVQQKPNREKALEYYNLSKQFNLKPSLHTYKLLMEAYANIPAYDMLTAHKLLTEMNKRHGYRPSAGHYATLIRSYGCLHRDVQSAVAVYKEMQKAGIKADETVYQAMMNTYIDNNDMNSAQEIYKDMLKQGTKSSAYIENLFIAGYGAHGQLDKAEQVFNRMSDSGDLVREPSTYEAMAKTYVENGEKTKAVQVVQQMRSRDFPPKVVDGVTQLIHAASK